jgi:HSP20 family protein
MAESVNRYFRMHIRQVRPSNRLWSPAADIYKRPDGWIVKVDLAGVKLDDIMISIDGNVLRISGRRLDSSYGENVAYHQLEITYSRFEKVLKFPCSIEGAKITRDYHDGLLILQLRSEHECSEPDELEEQ